MDHYEDIFKRICRVCLKIVKSDKMEPLIDNTDPTGLSCFGKSIPKFTSVTYFENDKLPTNVCKMCIHLLKQAIQFKITCELSEKLLKNVVEESLKNNSSYPEIQENICQFVMYKHYFLADNVLKYNKIKYCPFPKKNIPGVNTDFKPINCEENQQLTNKRFKLKTKNSLQADNILNSNKTSEHCPLPKITNTKSDIGNTQSLKYELMIENFLPEASGNGSADYDDNYNNSNKIEIKPTPNVVYKNNKKQKRSRKQIIDKPRALVKENIFKKKVKRQKHFKERNIPCKICNKVLANRETHNIHMERHNIGRYVCDKCGKSYPVLTQLHVHQITIHGIGPYLECNECSFKAPSKLTLTEHIRLHTGERPYTCDKCGLTFRRRAIWRKHQVLHTEKTIQCKICPKKFHRESCMLSHMNNVHERKYVYMCSVCDVTYAGIVTVRRHMVFKHGIKKELQGKIKRIVKSSDCISDK